MDSVSFILLHDILDYQYSTIPQAVLRAATTEMDELVERIGQHVNVPVRYLIVIPWARVVCLIYTPEARGPQARGLRVYISGEPRVHMV